MIWTRLGKVGYGLLRLKVSRLYSDECMGLARQSHSWVQGILAAMGIRRMHEKRRRCDSGVTVTTFFRFVSE